MGRNRRKIEWERYMGKQAWTAAELAPKLDLDRLTTLHFLRISFFGRRLERKRFGRTWFWVVRRFLSPPDGTYPCPRCHGRMEIFHVKCGCLFQICLQSNSHSVFKYCSLHKGTTPRKKSQSSDNRVSLEVKSK